MKRFNVVTSAVLIALFASTAIDAQAQAVGQANHGHHGGGNSGALGSSAGAKGGSGAGQSGSGGLGDCDITHYVLCDGHEG